LNPTVRRMQIFLAASTLMPDVPQRIFPPAAPIPPRTSPGHRRSADLPCHHASISKALPSRAIIPIRNRASRAPHGFLRRRKKPHTHQPRSPVAHPLPPSPSAKPCHHSVLPNPPQSIPPQWSAPLTGKADSSSPAPDTLSSRTESEDRARESPPRRRSRAPCAE
jgi:hypothetical protein